jgi:hypothetical protein
MKGLLMWVAAWIYTVRCWLGLEKESEAAYQELKRRVKHRQGRTLTSDNTQVKQILTNLPPQPYSTIK